MKSTLIEENDTLVRREVITDNEILIFNYGEDKPQSKNSGEYLYMPFYSPVFIYNDILKHKNTIRYLGFDKDSNCEVIVYSSTCAEQVAVYIDTDKARIESTQMLKYENIEGDYYLQFFYEDYKLEDKFELPFKITVKEWDEVKFEFICDYKNIREKSVDNTLSFAISRIAKNLYKVSYPTGFHYSYIVDFGDSVGIIEAPISESYMGNLTRFVSQNFSNKPIKYCFLTHHHPDHAGGFPYFYKNGAIIVTTELSSIYQKELLDKRHSLSCEKVHYTTNGKFDIIKKDEVKDYSNYNLKIKALEFSNNGHTYEFLVYYFPESNILIVGDLYYIRGSEAKASERPDRLFEFINKNKLKLKDLYTNWMPSSARIATMNDIKISSKAFRKRSK